MNPSILDPVGPRIVVCDDEPRRETRGGIILPDSAKIHTLTGRVVAISEELKQDFQFNVRLYDRVLYYPRAAVPVDLEQGNRLFVVDSEDVLGVFRKGDTESETA